MIRLLDKLAPGKNNNNKLASNRNNNNKPIFKRNNGNIEVNGFSINRNNMKDAKKLKKLKTKKIFKS